MAQELKFQAALDRLPPQNIEAEEAILGGILLDPEAIGRVTDLLAIESFYISAHREIYRAMLDLQHRGQPTDLMTVTSWLKDQGLLEKAGGQAKLAQLVDRTISAANVDQYAKLVMEKYTRRKLIQIGGNIAQLGYETDITLEHVLDKAEQQLFGITQDRPQQGLTKTEEILAETFSDIERRSMGMVLPGIACGFYDLDAMTQGFQRSDLIIAAGRPAMGKCLPGTAEILLADGTVATLQQIYQSRQAQLLTLNAQGRFQFTQPSAFIDDGVKPIFTITTGLGRQVQTTLSHPFLTLAGWLPLAQLSVGMAIGVPRRLPVFGVKALPSHEIERLARFVSEDSPGGHDQAQLSFSNPVWQLPKAQLAFFLQQLLTPQGQTVGRLPAAESVGYGSVSQKLARQIQHLLLRFGIISTLKTEPRKCQGAGQWTWQIEITDAIALAIFAQEILPQPALVGAGRSALGSRPSPEISKGEDIGDIYWDKIVSIKADGLQQVYDLTIPETHNFVANDICVHNTSFVLNVARNIATGHKQPVAIFSLEMSKQQLVYRLLSSEAKIESGRLRTGRIAQHEWEPLGHAISSLSQLPVFIDDTPNISVTEMRSKCRRLQAENGGALGLILIDYLQLMEGNSDNRVQELSKITRSLKGLARELNVPIISLSQLSRGVESRTNKRPMMSDLRESGCLTGDTLITLANNNQQVPIQDLIGRTDFSVWALNETTRQLQSAPVSHAFATGTKPVFKLTTRAGRTIRATANHRFRTTNGWQRLDTLKIGQPLATPAPLSTSVNPLSLGQLTQAEDDLSVHKYQQALHRVRAQRRGTAVKSPPLVTVASSYLYWDAIVAIEPDGVAAVFDLTVPDLHNFVANNIIVHNSIEQDADLVMMLYREEYYDPDTPDRGIAEVIIAKHRNGPTGTIKLLFEPQFTLFRNLAKPGG